MVPQNPPDHFPDREGVGGYGAGDDRLIHGGPPLKGSQKIRPEGREVHEDHDGQWGQRLRANDDSDVTFRLSLLGGLVMVL